MPVLSLLQAQLPGYGQPAPLASTEPEVASEGVLLLLTVPTQRAHGGRAPACRTLFSLCCHHLPGT